jgi:SAM-dependent methyltransferase
MFGVMARTQYDSAYFDAQSRLTRESAEVIVPIVMELLSPRSVCDVGCGRGMWLAVFAEHGVGEVLGIDGEYVSRETLAIDPDSFFAADLEGGVPAAGPFDLAVSLEVAEHLPESVSGKFVEGLVGLAPAVLFSAAVPGQGGAGHVNEQWAEYWRALFARHDYLPVDCVRPKVWRSPQVRVWYKQNMLLFASRALIESREGLRQERERSAGWPLSVVHPGLFEMALERPWNFLRKLTEEVEAGRLTKEELDEQMARMLEHLAECARPASPRQ